MDTTQKPYELTFDARDQYLYVHIHSEIITRQIALEYLTETVAECRAGNYKRLLLYRDIPEMMSEAEVFMTAKDFVAMIGGIRTAVVNPYISNERAMEFAVLVGTNRGALYNVFNNTADAESWLLS